MRYELAALGIEVSALAVERRLRYLPPARNLASTGNDTTFTISCPVIVVARAGVEFGVGGTGADKQQWQCMAGQQFIGCDCEWRHGVMAPSYGTPRTGKLPMREIATSAVTSLKAMRISG